MADILIEQFCVNVNVNVNMKFIVAKELNLYSYTNTSHHRKNTEQLK